MSIHHALVTAAAENFVLHVTHAARGPPGARVRREPDLVVVDSGVASDTFNVACRARLSPPTAGARIAGAAGSARP
jgi:hypothetical protein